MDQAFIFEKTYQERLVEYTDVLSGYDILPASQIKQEWAFFLELTVDQTGWQAIWKVSRIKCEELNIPFPTVVLVFVENIDYHNLEASVKIIAVQDIISLPEQLHVPLIHLWPTKSQERSFFLNLETTANSLDIVRFFYTHLFMSWDLEEDTSVDWFSTHLEIRLHLYYDMRNNSIPPAIVQNLNSLISEARRLQARREQLIAILEENDEDNSTNSPNVQNLVNIQVRMIQIRTEIELLENPVLRNTIIQNRKQVSQEKPNTIPQNWLVCSEDNIDNHMSFLNSVKTKIGNENVRFVPSLQFALEYCDNNVTIFLNKSTYVLGNMYALEQGGTIKGLNSRTDTVLTSSKDGVMIDCSGNIELENLTINSSVSQLAILVRRGTLVLKNCKILGDGTKSTHQGIVVLAEANLVLIDCEITHFYSAIVANSNSKISLSHCSIFNVNIGLKIYDMSNVTIKSSSFYKCRNYAIFMESDREFETGNCQMGSFEILNE